MMVYLPAIFFGLCFFNSIRKYGWNVEALLFSIYFVTGIASILLDANNLYDYNCLKMDLGFFAPIAYCLLLYICIKPFEGINKGTAICEVVVKNNRIVKYTVVIFFVIFIIDLYVASTSFTQILANSTLAQLRHNSYGEDRVSFYNHLQGLPRYICAATTFFFASSFYLLVIFFVNVINRKNKWYYNVMALLASMNQLIGSVFQADRSQFVYWIMMFVLLYTFFYKSIGRRHLKITMFAYILPVIVLGFSYILAVSLSRWGDSDNGTGGGMVLYLGQNFFNFCNYTNYFWDTPHSLVELFPLTHYLMGETYWDWCDLVESRTHIFIKNFSTFLGYICSISGPIIMIIYAIFYNRISTLMLYRKSNVVSLWYVTRFWIVALVPACGFFCYPYSFETNTIALFLWLIIGNYSRR